MKVYDNPKYYEIAFSFRDIPAEADFLESLIKAYSKIPVKTFLELASGNSPHIQELCKRGYRYVGLELNDEMIAYTKSKVRVSSIPADVMKGNMVQFSLPKSVDCALVFLGSLYVTNDEELLSHLHSVAETLKTGGLYILESVVSFYPEDVHTQSWECEDGDVKIITTYEAAWLDAPKQLMGGKIILEIRDGTTVKRVEHSEVKKIYTANQFIRLAEETNKWEHVGSFCDFDMNQVPREGARNILVLRRK